MITRTKKIIIILTLSWLVRWVISEIRCDDEYKGKNSTSNIELKNVKDRIMWSKPVSYFSMTLLKEFMNQDNCLQSKTDPIKFQYKLEKLMVLILNFSDVIHESRQLSSK